MICPFCGENNSDNIEMCNVCGYVFSKRDQIIRKDYTENADDVQDVIPGDTSGADLQMVMPNDESDTANKPEENNTVNVLNNKTEIEEWDETNKGENRKALYEKDYTRENKAELITSVISVIVVIITVLFGSTSEGVFGNPYVYLIFGVIGFIACIECTLLEGVMPCTFWGIVIRTIALILVIEMQNFITIPAYLLVYGLSAYYVVSIYRCRKPAVLLGLISMFLLPFMGYIIAVIIALFFRGMAGNSNVKRNRKGKR